MIDLLSCRHFIEESFHIEGEILSPTKHSVQATLLKAFIDKPGVLIGDVCKYAKNVAGPKAALRTKLNMNVMVGRHRPPPGGEGVRVALEMLLEKMREAEAFDWHQKFESLHPFLDGNGRTGRALWLWMMMRSGASRQASELGFLHTWYYQSLSNSRVVVATNNV